LRVLAGFALAIVSLAAFAAPPDASIQEIVVSDWRHSDHRSYRSMLDGMDVFEKFHAMAPDAALRFKIISRNKPDSAATLHLAIVGDTNAIPVPLAEDLSFTLVRDDAAKKDDAIVGSNRRDPSFVWVPDIRTPGLPPTVRRLGDLRLECMVNWAAKIRPPILAPAGYAVAALTESPCLSAMFHPLFIADRALFNITLQSGPRRQQISANWFFGANAPPGVLELTELRFFYDRLYVLPLADKSWDDDTMVEFDYMDDEAK